MNSEKSFYFVVLALFLLITVATILHINLYPPQLVFSQAVPLQLFGSDSTLQQPVLTTELASNATGDFQSRMINPVLVKLHLYSPSSSNLLMGTAIQETMIGRLSKNIFQISLDTAQDVNKYYLSKNPVLQAEVNAYYNSRRSLNWNLENNVKYEIAMARIIYLRTNKPLPSATDLGGLGKFWKVNYNTYLGKGTAHEYVENYEEYIKNRPEGAAYSA